jgi:hypothetical protein
MPATATPFAPADALARAIGYAINPLLFPPLAVAVVLAQVGAPKAEILSVTVLFALFFGVMPVAHLAWLLHRRRIASLEVVDRRARYEPLAVALGLNAIALWVVPGSGPSASYLLAVLLGCQLLNTAVVAAITLRWKISIHLTAAAGFAATLLFFSLAEIAPNGAAPGVGVLRPEYALWMVPVVGLLMWARVRARVHTPAEVLGGCLLGLILPLLELGILQAAGLLWV